MSSPSRIPRPKVCISKKQGKENIQQRKSPPISQDNENGKFFPNQGLKKSIKSDTKTNPTQVQTQKKSPPLRVLNENRFQQNKREEHNPTKATLHDRRGISEIKRSEKNLRLALEALENDFESLKHDLDAIKHEVIEKDCEIVDLKQNESLLKERLVNLQTEDEKKAEVLERMNCNPNTGEKLSAKGLASAAEKKQQEKFDSANFLLQHINDVKASLGEIQNRLDIEIC